MSGGENVEFQESGPLVSIVIPCYNQAHYLPDAIGSCLAQTYPNIEIVVVNDGSPDDTSSVARAFGDPVRVIEQPNTGLSGARNAGIRFAKGDVIVLLDADDRLLPDCVEARLAMLLQSDKCGAVIGAWWQMDPQGRQTRSFGTDQHRSSFITSREYVRGNHSPTCGAMFRKRVFVNSGTYDPFLTSFEDWDMMIRITLHWGVTFDPGARSEYRQVSGSMSRNYLRMHDNLWRMTLKNRAYFERRWEYWWDTTVAKWYSIIGLASMIFKESSFGQMVGRIAGYGLRRPAAIPYLAGYILFVVPSRLLQRKESAT